MNIKWILYQLHPTILSFPLIFRFFFVLLVLFAKILPLFGRAMRTYKHQNEVMLSYAWNAGKANQIFEVLFEVKFNNSFGFIG